VHETAILAVHEGTKPGIATAVRQVQLSSEYRHIMLALKLTPNEATNNDERK
jgi:hypothetical protein